MFFVSNDFFNLVIHSSRTNCWISAVWRVYKWGFKLNLIAPSASELKVSSKLFSSLWTRKLEVGCVPVYQAQLRLLSHSQHVSESFSCSLLLCRTTFEPPVKLQLLESNSHYDRRMGCAPLRTESPQHPDITPTLTAYCCLYIECVL